MTHGPSDKIVLKGRGDLRPPGSCIICGSGTRQEGYVDVRTFIDYHGQVYFCRLCIEQAADVFGCLTYDESEHLKKLSTEIAEENNLLKKELEHANSRLASYDTAFASALASVGVGVLPDGGSSLSTPESVEEGSEEPVNSSAQPEGSAGGKPTVKVSVKKSRSSDATGVRSDDDAGKISL